MAGPPYMQFYPGDYLADTQHLSTEEHGAYLLLLFNYWQRGKPLDNSNDRLTAVTRLSIERWIVVKPVLEEFFEIDGNTWIHRRLERDIDAYKQRIDQASAAGKASAAKRWGKDKDRYNGRSTHDKIPLQQNDNQKNRIEKNRIEKNSIATRFEKPKVEEVEAYCAERKNGISAIAFVNHYESKGWKIGTTPMKDWRAAVRTWEQRQRADEPRAVANQDHSNLAGLGTVE
jgi:uncharacterized protein YdaU (DUF1376 family)